MLLENLKAREVVGDGLEHDHSPSFAALRTAKEAELGRPLTELETKTLYQNSTAVEVPRDVHIAGPIYGGKKIHLLRFNKTQRICKVQSVVTQMHYKQI